MLMLSYTWQLRILPTNEDHDQEQDNDQDQDLIIATTLGIIFMENDGRANYTIKHTELIPESAPMSLSASDFDQDEKKCLLVV